MRSSSSDRVELTKGGNGGILRQPPLGSPLDSLLSLGVRRGETRPRLLGGVVEVGVAKAGSGVTGVLAKDVMAAAAALGPKRPYPDGEVK